MRKFILSLLILSAFTGCASSYQKYEKSFFSGHKGGYEDSQISNDQFYVSYIGSGQDSRNALFGAHSADMGKIRAYALKRAAELTVKHGFRYFTIISDDLDRVKGIPTYVSPGVQLDQYFDKISLHIQCHHAHPGSGAYDAAALLQ